MKARANDLSGFQFRLVGSGHYEVTYTNPHRGDYYVAIITDMTLIDTTHNAVWAKAKDIQHLRYVVKRGGTHYNKYGKRLCTETNPSLRN